MKIQFGWFLTNFIHESENAATSWKWKSISVNAFFKLWYRFTTIPQQQKWDNCYLCLWLFMSWDAGHQHGMGQQLISYCRVWGGVNLAVKIQYRAQSQWGCHRTPSLLNTSFKPARFWAHLRAPKTNCTINATTCLLLPFLSQV